jgi:hypothetical protein
MAKRKVGSQTCILIPDHKKSRIIPIPLRASDVQHTIRKLLMRAITSIQTSSQLKVYIRSYEPVKL